MLIGFRVKNYRSFGAEQTLTFRVKASPDAERLAYAHGVDCYKLQALYGANAGGKTNVLKAMAVFQMMVAESSKTTTFENGLPAEPFSLNPQASKEPAVFEIEFISHGCRYDYQVAFTREQIVKEQLSAFPKGREQVWFVREGAKSDWYFGRHFKGDKRLLKQVTRSDALFLSTAVQFNCEPLQPVFEWIRRNLVFFSGAGVRTEETLRLLVEHPESKAEILELVQWADPTIVDVRTKKRLFKIGGSRSDPLGENECPREGTEDAWALYFLHCSGNEMPWYQESVGTLKLLEFASLWRSAEREERVLVVDDWDAHLHPLLAERLLKKFVANHSGSQLLFTTHNTTYLSRPDILRREQIWLVERTPETQQSELYSLSDFHPLPRKEAENFETMYLDGRYGAVPTAGVEK